jgi:glycosyltransferase involved in cell wall biosynthesis
VRIAEICPPWLRVPPRGYGGIEWVVSLLADGLADAGHDVTLFATGDSVTRAHLESVFDEAPGSASINDPVLDATHALFALREARDRFDLIHVHAPFSALVAAVEVGVPVVHTVHGSFTPEMRRLYPLVGDRAWFVAISEAQRRTEPDLHYAGVVHNGVDLDAYPFGADKEDFLLFLGRAAPEKGWLRAIEAAKAAGLPLVSAVKIAHPTELDEWDRHVRSALPSGWTVLGELAHAEKMDLLRRAKAVLFPIDWAEPFGLVMIEAMACGTPVIATPRGAAPEVIEDGVTGWIVDVEGFAELAAAKIAGISDLDPAACRARVEERFSARAMVEGYVSVFRRVLESAEHGAPRNPPRPFDV